MLPGSSYHCILHSFRSFGPELITSACAWHRDQQYNFGHFFSSFFSTQNKQSTIKIKALKLYGRYKQNELQNYFDSIFTESNDNHSHDTRHKSLRYQLTTRTSTGRLCVRHYIPEILTQTPECITEKLDIHSCSGFSNYMKNYHIQNYKANCLIENCYICQN